ncbi:hypothetical protein TNCV_3869891 [Trichonephila clavipes]|nr:hypothetical protein TNCV_3869891 [Trichonephila clavipes]
MSTERSGFASSQDKLAELYSQEVMSGESGKRPQLSPLNLEIGRQWPGFPMAFQGSWFSESWQYICQCMCLSSSLLFRGSRGLLVVQLISLLGFLSVLSLLEIST